jgi:hypothetical protein
METIPIGLGSEISKYETKLNKEIININDNSAFMVLFMAHNGKVHAVRIK